MNDPATTNGFLSNFDDLLDWGRRLATERGSAEMRAFVRELHEVRDEAAAMLPTSPTAAPPPAAASAGKKRGRPPRDAVPTDKAEPPSLSIPGVST